uniref:hypothetical protein n=1 Tax=Actinoplanes sp. G11-F43 TaxID=3424130 RepID=UPI003D32B771
PGLNGASSISDTPTQAPSLTATIDHETAVGRLVGPDVVSRMDIDQVTGYFDLVHGGLTLSTDKLSQYGFSHGDNFTVSNFGKSSKLCPHC